MLISIINTAFVIVLSFLFVCLLGYAVIKLTGGYVRVHVISEEEDLQEYIKQLQKQLEDKQKD